MTKIMHFEDCWTASEITKRTLKKSIPGPVEYIHHDSPYCACPQIAIKNPDILICDYQFSHATLMSGLIDGIKSFKGDTYVLSSNSPEEIRRLVPELPARVKVFSKANLRALVQDIRGRSAVSI